MESAIVGITGISVSPKGVAGLAKKWFETTVVREKPMKLLADGEHEQEQRRIVGTSHWVDHEVALYESDLVRSAFQSFDTIYNFLAAANAVEKCFFSVYLKVYESHKSLATIKDGHTLALRSIQKPDAALQTVTDLVNHVKLLAEALESQYADSNFTLVVDASICDTPGFPRSDRDRKGFIAMAKTAVQIVFMIAGVHYAVEWVKIVRGATPQFSKTTRALCFITADWESNADSAVTFARKMRKLTYDTSTGMESFIQKVEKLGIDTQDKKNIFMIGNTGAGKSYSANWVLDMIGGSGLQRFPESCAESMTSYVDFLPHGNESEWRVWDTPGLNDSYGRDDKFIHDIEHALHEASRVHAIIMCFASLERIDEPMKRTIRLCSRLFREGMQKSLLVFVNRQQKQVSMLQKKNLQIEIRSSCGFSLDISYIFDMSGSSVLRESEKNAKARLGECCSAEGMKVGQTADVIRGLQLVKDLKNVETQDEAKRKLVDLSAEALSKILKGGDEEPDPRLQPSTGMSIIMSNRKVYEMRDGIERCIEYHLEMPQHIRARFDRRISLFAKCLRLWNADVEKVVKVIKSMNLVYRMLPEERSESRRYGVLRQVYKVHLQLWGIDDALLDDTKYQVERMLGVADARHVSYYESMMNADSRNLKNVSN